MIEWSNLITWNHYIEGFVGDTANYYAPSLSINSPNFGIYLWFFIGLISIGALASIYRTWADSANPLKERLGYLSSNAITLGLLGLAWFMSRMLNFRFISGRFMMLVWGIYFLVIVFYIIRYLLQFFPIEWNYYQKNKLHKA